VTELKLRFVLSTSYANRSMTELCRLNLAAAVEPRRSSRADRAGTPLRAAASRKCGGHMSSTTVPLTVQVLKLTMPLHDLPGGSGAGESLAKRSTRETCTVSEQAHLVSCLTLV
jgi:hypothetical protein